MRCVAVDPGVWAGWSLFVDGVLTDCGALKDYPGISWLGKVDRAIIEMPEIYPGSPVSPNTLTKLAVGVGKYAGRLEDLGAVVTLVFPKEWKGQIVKAAHHPRIFAKLSPSEQDLVGTKGKGLAAKPLGDMMDSVGLGQWAKTMKLWT